MKSGTLACFMPAHDLRLTVTAALSRSDCVCRASVGRTLLLLRSLLLRSLLLRLLLVPLLLPPRRLISLLLAALSICTPGHTAHAQDSTERTRGTPELMRTLANGGYLIYFRHGHTHWQQKIIESAMQAEGRHDLDNCATQRNLDQIGRDDAANIHAALSAARIPVGKVLGSLYCRPSEYVGLITGKTPVRTPWLTGLSTPETLVEIKREVATPPAAGTNTFLGGHGDRPFDLTGLVIQEGDALVFDARNHVANDPGKFKPVAWIKPGEWVPLASAVAAAGASQAQRASGAPAFTAGTVSISGATHHDADNVRASLPRLHEGQAVDAAALARTLQLVRENPAKNLEPAFTPVAQSGTANANIAVGGTKPWSLNTGLTNTSVAGGRRERLWLGGEYVNLWNRDHQAALQLSGATNDWSRNGNASFAYRAPLYAFGGMLGLTATRARDGGGLDADLRNITGAGRSTGVYYRQHLTPRADYHHHVSLRLDDRDWFTTPAAGAPAVAATPQVRSRPLTLGYAGHWEENWMGWKFGAQWASNLAGGAGNDGASYALARPGAQRNWNALKLDGEWVRILTYDIRLMVRGRAQLSNQALIPGEQFALGAALQPWGSAFSVWQRAPWIGSSGVRGLPERAASGDSGAQASVELWSRQIGSHDLRAGGFVDFGTVRRNQPVPGLAGRANAASIGALLHFQLRGNVALSLHAAHVLRGADAVARNTGSVGATLVMRY